MSRQEEMDAQLEALCAELGGRVSHAAHKADSVTFSVSMCAGLVDVECTRQTVDGDPVPEIHVGVSSGSHRAYDSVTAARAAMACALRSLADAMDPSVAEIVREVMSKSAVTVAPGASRRAPYGYRVSDLGEVVEFEPEQRVIAEIKRMRVEGLTLSQIGAALASAGMLAYRA